MNQHLDYSDLAYGFIQNALSTEGRKLVQELILKDAKFLEVLRLELALTDQLRSLKHPIPYSVKGRIYSNITGTKSQMLYKIVLSKILEATLPRVFRPMLQLFERSVFASE